MQCNPSKRRLTRPGIAHLILISVVFLTLQFDGVVWAASSHQDLGLELIKDLQQDIRDSTLIEPAYQQLLFTGETELAAYFNTKYGKPKDGQKADSISTEIQVILGDYDLTLNNENAKTVRNTTYTRKLELNVVYVYVGQKHGWQGTISDKLSIAELGTLLEEPFPGTIGGDYQKNQPHPLRIVLTTLGIFYLIQALFFIRT